MLGSLPGRTSQFSPSDKLDVLFPKEFVKSLASKEVEIALAPGGAPSVAFKCGGLHFLISEGWVDDEFSNARLEILESGPIEISPLLRWDVRTDGNGVVEDNISGSQTGFKVGMVCEPISRDENRQLVIAGNPKEGFEKFLSVIDKSILMRIEMSRMDAADKVVGSVLDAGCGTGEHALFFAARGHVVTGFDFLEEPIAAARRKAVERSLIVK